jgi:GNAT superfamily N-acetyltransferase
MIEIRTYDGDAATLSRFSQEVWRASYEGRVTFPLWSAQYFDWQLLTESRSRDYLVAAYEGSKLIGTLLAEAFRFRLHGREVNGTTGSWLSVHPDYRRMGIGSKLFEEQRRRHLERDAPFML